MSPPLLLGAGLGLGLLAILRGLTPQPPRLDRALADLATPRQPATADSGGAARQACLRLARRLAALADNADGDRQARDLRLVGRSVEHHLLTKLAGATAGLALPVLAVAVTRAGGLELTWIAALLPAAALTPAGYLLPDLQLRRAAADRRDQFTHALGSYLDLAAILLAGGAGTETALYAAADVGDGWAHQQLRAALARCALTGQTPWASLARLGRDLGADELCALAASVGLAGEHGAKVRDSLTARAQSLRARQLAHTEAAAQAATERMTIPTVLMAVAFLLFVGYPAVAHVLGGL